MSGAAERRVAFVTGAASGIGRAAAAAFCAAGYATALVDVSRDAGEVAAAALRESGSEARFLAADVSDDAAVRAAVEGTLAAWGRLDAAFNAAGIDGEMGKAAADCAPENWARVIGVNLTGVWHCMRHQIPAMLANGGGAIVNCASSAGIVGAPMYGAYTASKHGIVGLTRSAALDYARSGVRVNAVAPGMIDTPMNDSIPPDLLEVLLAESPAGRLGRAEEIASAVVFLCGDGASFITGQVLPIDGAWTSR